MRENLDACPEYDDRLLERAFRAAPDAGLDRHLASCARCRSARDRYVATAAALVGALAETEPTSLPRRKRAVGLGWVLAAAALLVVVSLWWTRRPSGIRWIEDRGAVVLRLAADRVRLDDGSATFVVGSTIVVETSIGEIRAESAEFTVVLTAPDAAKIDVARGSVRWVDASGEVLVEEGRSMTRGPMSANDSGPELDRTARDPASVERVRAPVAGGFEIHGRVLDAETGEAVPGAEVVLCARKGEQPALAARARSEADGTFRARSAPADDALLAHSPFAGRFAHPETFLTVEAEGYAPSSEAPPEPFLQKNPLDVRDPIDLGDLKIFRGARVSGRVVLAESGRTLSDARILLAASSSLRPPFVGEDAKEVARCKTDGSFVLDRRVGPCAQDRKHCLFAISSSGLGWKELDVLATQRDVSDVEIPIGPAAALDVLVLVDDPSHAPISGATVTVEPGFAPLVAAWAHMPGQSTLGFVSDEGLRSCFQQVTDASGRARFEHVPLQAGGRYDVFARMDGYVRGFESNVDPERRPEVRLVLRRDWTWSVEGTVKTEEGVPIVGATVEAAVGRSPRTTTDVSGAYRFEGLEHGASGANLLASAPGFVAQRLRVQVLRKDAGVPFRADLMLKRALPIAGRIVDQHGTPVAGASLSIHQGNTWLSLASEGSKTGADGSFRFDEATAGDWSLGIQSPDPATDWMRPWSQHTLAGGDTEARIVLERDERSRSRLLLDVVDAETSAPVDPIAVQAFPNASGAHDSWANPIILRRPGGATIDPLHPGDWRIWVRVGRVITSQVLRIEEGEAEHRATVSVGRPGVLSGRVEFDGENDPVRVCVLSLYGDGDRPGDNEWKGGSLLDAYRPIEADGSFRLEDVSPGPWSLTVRDRGWIGSASVDVPSGGEGRCVIRPVRSARLDFRTGASPGDIIVYSIAEGDESAWRLAMRMGGMKGREYVEEQTVKPGRVRWKVQFLTENRVDAPDAALPQEGELEVAAGDVIDVPVPVVTRH